jgi:hypothetical protein
MVRVVCSHYCTLGTGWRSSWKIQSGRWLGWVWRRLAEHSEVCVVLGEEVVGELRPALQPRAPPAETPAASSDAAGPQLDSRANLGPVVV